MSVSSLAEQFFICVTESLPPLSSIHHEETKCTQRWARQWKERPMCQRGRCPHLVALRSWLPAHSSLKAPLKISTVFGFETLAIPTWSQQKCLRIKWACGSSVLKDFAFISKFFLKGSRPQFTTQVLTSAPGRVCHYLWGQLWPAVAFPILHHIQSGFG